MRFDRHRSLAPLRGSPALWGLLAAAILAFVPVVAGSYLFVPDDVYFYLKIAGEIVEGNGSTFNGLVPTNGFHPLWMLVCILERAIIGPDRVALIQLHLAVTGLCNLVSIVLAHRLGRRLGFDGFVTAGAVGAYLSYNALGSEIHISAPLVLLATLLLVRSDATSGRGLVELGLVLGLVMLARLDNVFVVGVMTLCGVWGATPRNWADFVRRGLTVGLPAAAVVAPYLAWNWISFGHLVPISGAIKAGLAAETLVPKLGLQASLMMLAVPVSLVVAWRTTTGMRRNAWLAIGIGALLHAGYVLARMENVWTWYYTSELVSTALLLESGVWWTASRLLPRARWPRTAMQLAALLPLLAIAWLNLRAVRSDPEPWVRAMARLLDETLPPGAAVAAACAPGAIGYYSDHPVFALDGLTLDFAFHERAAERGLAKTLAELGVQYVYAPGPRSAELTRLVRETERRGHGGEGIGFHGPELESGESELQAISVVSPTLGRSLGRICLGAQWLAGPGLSRPRMGIWKLPPDGGCADDLLAGFRTE